MAAALARWLVALALALVLVGCSVTSVDDARPTAQSRSTISATTAVRPSPSLAPGGMTPSPWLPATPSPVGSRVTVAGCCGTFAWLDAQRLVVYDAPQGGDPGAWLVARDGSSRTHLDSVYGLPSPTGLVAVPDAAAGITRIRDAAGTVRGVIPNGGHVTWISPDGLRVSWLEPLPVRTPSSSVDRAARIWTAGVDGANPRAVADLLAAEVAWTADGHSLIAAARALDGSSPGIWVIDVESGATRVVVETAFPQNVRLSPSRTLVAYVETFSGDPATDGLWVASLTDERRRRVPVDATGYRWGATDDTLWLLEYDDAGDRLVEVAAGSGDELRTIALDATVRGDVWEIAPDGRALAFWRDDAGTVEVLAWG